MGNGNRHGSNTYKLTTKRRLVTTTRCGQAHHNPRSTNTERWRGVPHQCKLPGSQQSARHTLSLQPLATTLNNTLPRTHRRISHQHHSYGSNSTRQLRRRRSNSTPRDHGKPRHSIRHHQLCQWAFRPRSRRISPPLRTCRRAAWCPYPITAYPPVRRATRRRGRHRASKVTFHCHHLPRHTPCKPQQPEDSPCLRNKVHRRRLLPRRRSGCRAR